jgi:hypothetical protein
LHHDVEDLGGEVAEEGPEVKVVVGKLGEDGGVHIYRASPGAIRGQEARGASVVAARVSDLTLGLPLITSSDETLFPT